MVTKREHGWLYLDKTDFQSKSATRNKDGQYIIRKRSIHQEYITIITIYTPNIGVLKYVKQILTEQKGLIYRNTNNTNRQQWIGNPERKSIRKLQT